MRNPAETIGMSGSSRLLGCEWWCKVWGKDFVGERTGIVMVMEMIPVVVREGDEVGVWNTPEGTGY